jgi:FkbM family methyltransferase
MMVQKTITSLKKFLIKNTEDDSFFRKALRDVYMYFPREYRESYFLDKTIKSIGKNNNIKFVQIGANDGIQYDPLFPYVKKRSWKGLMVEPNPIVFKELKENHKNSRSDLTFCNYAIGEEGEFTLFWCEELTGVASFDKEHVVRHLNGANYKILEEDVKMIPFLKLLTIHPTFKKVNILIVDTEGWDAKIIQSINFKEFLADLIVFESWHVEESVLNETIEYLENYGYNCFSSRGDTTAIYRKTELNELREILLDNKYL